MSKRAIASIGVFLAGLAIAGCSSAPRHPEAPPAQAATPAKHRLLDTLCFQDCMGENSGKEFCEDRCTY